MLNRNAVWVTILIVCLYANTSLSFTPLLADTHTTFKMKLSLNVHVFSPEKKKRKRRAKQNGTVKEFVYL